MWTPGYWAYGEDGYYWVPGAWVPAPYEGALWTPAYWGWSDGQYVFHDGYWGPHVGYYGGVNYGFGYMGVGFVGGEWRGHEFAYNTAVVRVNTTVIRNVYVDRTIVERNTIVNDRHVAFSGGPGGIRHDPQPEERMAMRESHVAPTSFQQQHFQAARSDRSAYVKTNGGRPQNLAVARPLPAENHQAPNSLNHGGPAGGVHSGPAPSFNNRPGAVNETNRPGAANQNGRPGTEYQNNNRPAPTYQNNNRPAPTYQNPTRPNTPAPQYRTNPQPNGQSHPNTTPHTEYQSRPNTPTQSHPAPPPKPKPESHDKQPKR
jgi:hypothetical protein